MSSLPTLAATGPDTRPGDCVPTLRITGDATPEEVAAIVTVLASLQSPATPTGPRPSAWLASTRPHRPRTPAMRSWRASGLPS
ncbi:hypothetical protein JCM18899A_55270 [Nocardioides sp. AN3]